MDITTLAAWGEFIGGIAVVVSLIYLASQIRQNSRLLRASGGSAAAWPTSPSRPRSRRMKVLHEPTGMDCEIAPASRNPIAVAST